MKRKKSCFRGQNKSPPSGVKYPEGGKQAKKLKKKVLWGGNGNQHAGLEKYDSQEGL